MLVFAGSYWGRKFYIDYKHPYRDLDVIGAWDYSYSVAFDMDEKLVREDKEMFSLEMYTETEIALNDDGTFRICIEDINMTGTWFPEEHNSNIFLVSPNESNMNEVIVDNTIRWDRGEDKLCIELSKNKVPEGLRKIFQGNENCRYIFCKTFRNTVREVYTERDDSYEYDEWDEGDNGLPFNYHP